MPSQIGIALTGIQASQFDPASIAFFGAAGVTNTTEKYAVNYLTTQLKLNSLWSKMDFIYPFVGGSSTPMSYNLKNTAQYQGTFNGGWTLSSTGALGNGTNAYFNTNYPMNTMAQNSGHLSIYIRTDYNNNNSTTDIGASSAGGIFAIIESRTGNTTYSSINSSSFNSPASADSRGFWLDTRTASNSDVIYRNGATGNAGTFASAATDATTITIGARNTNGTIAFYAPREYAFASGGAGLTFNEQKTLNTIITQFQTLLSRNV